MSNTTRLMWIHALSPVHAGTGQSVGAVDLAIARDRATDHPYIPGSSIKGSLSDAAGPRVEGSWRKMAFGPNTPEAAEHAGQLAFGDAHLLLLPVRSIAGTFAWATSPLLLGRYARDAREAGVTPPALPAVGGLGTCLVTGATALEVGRKVIFEDLDFQPDADRKGADAWAEHIGARLFPGDTAWQNMLKQRLCVVHDDAMTYLARHGTDVRMRVALESDSKTAKNGQLWTEETLPVESVLVALVAARPNGNSRNAAPKHDLFGELNKLVQDRSIQLGGNATVGQGRCQIRLDGGDQ
ncbi:MAG: type III-B CRISPR module RAMP protein Cmr4 [Myxococcales bacterium]|nr:type III-B CRISPR module RAMP protein Cmr4 [Myxococcales bacterium]